MAPSTQPDIMQINRLQVTAQVRMLILPVSLEVGETDTNFVMRDVVRCVVSLTSVYGEAQRTFSTNNQRVDSATCGSFSFSLKWLKNDIGNETRLGNRGAFGQDC